VVNKKYGEVWRKLAKVLGVSVESAFKYDYKCLAGGSDTKLIWPYTPQADA
jgi:hypothetical protein